MKQQKVLLASTSQKNSSLKFRVFENSKNSNKIYGKDANLEAQFKAKQTRGERAL